jgi:hypothetical protein
MKHKILKKHLKVGNIIPIYLNWKNQTNFRGNAILLKRLENREPPNEERIYEFKEIGNLIPNRIQDKISILYSYQWWLIKFIDGKDTGFQTATKIAHYNRTFWTKPEDDE